MRNKWIYLVIGLIVSGELYAQTPYIPFSRTLNKGGIDFEANAEYFITQQIADSDGKTTDLPDTSSHSRLDMDIIGKYGITNQLELYGGIKARYIQTGFEQDFGGGAEEYNLTTSGLESYVIGGRFSFKEVERLKYSITGYYRQPTYTNLEYDGINEPQEVAFGEGSRQYGLGASLHYKTKSKNIVETQVMYRSPGEDQAHEIFIDVRGGFVWNTLSIYGGVENIISRSNDAYTDDEANKPAVFQGSSVFFNSINRQWTAPYLGINFAMGRNWRLNLRGTMVNSGTATDLGPRILIGLGYRNEPNPGKFNKRNSKFKQYRVEGVVSKLTKSRKTAIIDKGAKNGLRKGMKVDFYFFDFVGGNELIATGRILKVKYNKSLVKITRRYSRRRVKEGTVARSDEILDQ